MDLKELDILGNNIFEHWYYRSKAKAVCKLLSNIQFNKVLDVGAGSGFFTKYLIEKNFAQEACCVDTSYPSNSSELYLGKTIEYKTDIKYAEANLVLLMDVLEHVDNDVDLLKEYIQKVPKNTYFLISVPAFQFLWSGHDVFLEHKRRYTINQLESVVVDAGLNIIRSSYYFAGVFPLAITTRIFSKIVSNKRTQHKSQLKNHSRIINSVLSGVSSLEIPLMKYNRIAGLTVFCLAQSA